MLERISPSALAWARETLATIDPVIARAHEALPPFPWRIRPGGFEGLVRLVVEQQLSVASANSIWKRLVAGLGEVAPSQILSLTIEELKRFGLSTPKAGYVYAIASAVEKGAFDFDELTGLDDENASSRLITLKGIGRWTAEVYLMCCEARMDVFPAGDIALQEAVRILDGTEHRPSTQELYQRSCQWSPYRSVAAQLLWGYYGAIKRKTLSLPQGVSPFRRLISA